MMEMPSASRACSRGSRRRSRSFLALTILCLFSWTGHGGADDWPMWRYDVGRTSASPQVLPAELHLQWVREFPPLVPAWEDPLNQDLMQFDRVYEPVVLGRTLLIGSSVSDRLVAVDTETGEERWSFYTGGPVRLPPVAADGKVYFTSDDGYLYCVEVATGELRWRFRGGPGDGKVLGNSRLISTWPARGGPVLGDGVVYFAAGIWPFMGVFVHALDAETGAVIWTNDSSGSRYMLQPHNSPAYGGVAPQGALVISGDRLLVPCGRSVPACFDRRTGEFLYYQLSQNNKTGGAFLCAVGDRFVNYHRDGVTSLYDLHNGEALIPRFGRVPVATGERLFCTGDSLVAFDLGGIREVEYDKRVRDRKTREYKTVKAKKWLMDRLWQSPVDGSGDLIKAGERLFAGGRGVVSALDLPAGGGPPTLSWQTAVDGTVGRLIAADGRLFAVTVEGRIYAFGAASGQPRRFPYAPGEIQPKRSRTREARDILAATGVREGYCLAYGLEDGGLLEALARLSELCIIAVDADADKVERLRRSLDKAGLYGSRISVHVGDPFSFAPPPYIASLTVFEDLEAAGYARGASFLQEIYRSTRPYGGIACFPAGQAGELRDSIADLPGARVRRARGLALLSREGPLPGADDWTHQYGDVANTVKSDDRLVKLPLGLLWFGGNSHMDVLPRHGHGPPEQVVGGRLFIEGIDCLSARDVYTGRVLWKRTFPNLGTFGVYYDSTYFNAPLSTAYNQVHIPGANARGTNFVVTADRVYLARQGGCLVLDPASGETLDEFHLPDEAGDEPAWGYIGVYEEYLIAGTGAVRYTDFLDLTPEQRRKSSYNLNTTSSRNLVVLDRYSGELLWSYTSAQGLRHNAIVAGSGKLFCIDRMSSMVADALKRRGKRVPGTPALLAFAIGSGEVIWRTTKGVSGTWLGYSEEHDVLLQAGRKTRDTVVDEPKSGMAAYRGRDGVELWSSEVSYGGPCILHGATIITDRHAFDLLTGEQEMRRAPLTGAEEPWAFTRRYGCNYNIASEYLLTFRSAAAGFYDLENDGGTGSFGGFRSGCTSNLVVANGVLNAPDYTRTCTCSYQNQTSLALVHMPEVELWVTYLGESDDGPIREIGVNLGAPGNRRAPDGCFWIGHPLLPHVDEPEKESGLTAGISVAVGQGGYYTHHASSITGGDGPAWVAASGCRGISRLELDLRARQRATYEVSLHFADPDGSTPGKRVFDVLIEGRRVLADLDISAEAGGANRALVQTFVGIAVDDGKLTLEFVPARPEVDDDAVLPILCGLRARREIR